MTVLAVLKKAREEYERCGVNRFPEDGEMCAVTAMSRATDGDSRLYREARNAFLIANGLPLKSTVHEFNDSHTRLEVLNAFYKAIEYEVGRG